MPVEVVGREFEPLYRSLQRAGAAAASVVPGTSESVAVPPFASPTHSFAVPQAPRAPRPAPAPAAGGRAGLPRRGSPPLRSGDGPPKESGPKRPPAAPCPQRRPAHLPAAAHPPPACPRPFVRPVLRGGRRGGRGCYIRHLRLAQWAVGARGRDRLMYCVRGRRAVT